MGALAIGIWFFQCAPIDQFLKIHSVLPRSADAIMVLAGSMDERLPAAAQLYKDGYAPVVILSNDGIFSSWSTKYGRNLYAVEWAEEKLVSMGVRRDAIIKLSFIGNGTVYEALSIKPMVFLKDIRSLILVTSDYHTRRADWTFHKILENYPVNISIYPSWESDHPTNTILLEYVKLIYYRLRFGLFGLLP